MGPVGLKDNREPSLPLPGLRRLAGLAWGLLLCFLSCTSPPSAVSPPQGTADSLPGKGDSAAEGKGVQEEMVEIPAGPSLFGATEEHFQFYLAQSRLNFPGMVEKTRRALVVPRRQVHLPAYRMDRFEVTNQDYARFVDATGYRPSHPRDYLKHWTASGRYPEWAALFPVVWVSQEDAEAYCHWRGLRLPSEEEWEKAARGKDGLLFPWGNRLPTAETTNSNSPQMEPVGNRPEDRSPDGVYDLGGNVAEWTGTRILHDGNEVAVVRGGSYRTALRETLTFHRDLSLAPGDRTDWIGFRCAGAPP